MLDLPAAVHMFCTTGRAVQGRRADVTSRLILRTCLADCQHQRRLTRQMRDTRCLATQHSSIPTCQVTHVTEYLPAR